MPTEKRKCSLCNKDKECFKVGPYYCCNDCWDDATEWNKRVRW